MLEFLHTRGHLKKVPTNLVLMTPNTQQTIQLDELNKMIAEQKGVSLEQLAINDGSVEVKTSEDIIVSEVPVAQTATPIAQTKTVSADDLRSKADQLLAEAKSLRELADKLDTPKAKATKTKKISVAV